MKHTLEEICNTFGINQSDILNAYSYGSHVYGTATQDSDYDYILVHKPAFIGPDKNAFKENAKSSPDKKMQIISFSRTGFKAELQRFNMSCLECINLPEEFVLQKKMDYNIERYDEKEFVKNIIIKASNSWHLAVVSHKEGNHDHAAKGIYHALRILEFALQIQTFGKIVNFPTAKLIKKVVADNIASLSQLRHFRDEYFTKLRDQHQYEKSI